MCVRCIDVFRNNLVPLDHPYKGMLALGLNQQKQRSPFSEMNSEQFLDHLKRNEPLSVENEVASLDFSSNSIW